MTLRIVFMGTPDFAVPTLAEIIGQGHEVVAVYTQPPRPAGRGMAERRSPVHELADKFGIPVLTPASLRSDEEQQRFAALGAEAAVVVAYGLILPKAILDATPLGAFNLHASLLPRWRGAAPIQRAIMAGDAETGVAVMQMEAGLDTGPIAMVERTPIGPDETAGALHDRLARLGADLMGRALAALERGSLAFMPQSEDGATYAAKVDKGETRIDWSRGAAEIHNRIRGLSPFPGAWTEMPIGGKAERVKLLGSSLAEDSVPPPKGPLPPDGPLAPDGPLPGPPPLAGEEVARQRGGRGIPSAAPGTVLDEALTIACGEGAVRIAELQRAGGRAMSAEEFLRGAGVPKGTRLG